MADAGFFLLIAVCAGCTQVGQFPPRTRLCIERGLWRKFMDHIPYEGYRWRLVRKAYDFFRQVEAEQRHFTLHDLQQATGYSVETIKSYLTKRWEAFLIEHPSSGDFTCQGLLACSWERFAQLHRQKHSPQDLPLQHDQTNQPSEESHVVGWKRWRILLTQLLSGLLVLLKRQRT